AALQGPDATPRPPGCPPVGAVVRLRPRAYRDGLTTMMRGEAGPHMAIKFAAARFTEQEALLFHSQGKPGKLEITPTKPLTTQRDLSLAYSPGVAVPVLAIARDPHLAYDYTNKANLVAVVSNGTALLGLGNLGAQAAKPVMEGKGALFKRFADIDAIDILVDTPDVEAVINCVRYLGPSFGGINLE